MIKSFKDIPQFPRIHYTVNLSWNYLDEWLEQECSPRPEGMSSLVLCPDFQRGHVWTEAQQIAYVEFILSGGSSGRNLYFNHPNWMDSYKGDFVLVDGFQRITAVQKFLHNEIKAFGLKLSEFTGKLPSHDADFIVCIAKLKTRKEVLNWYVLMNAGGTPHSQKEIDRVKKMMQEE